MSTLFDLSGKVALVTGATKGIGRGVAEQLVAAGAKVVVSSRGQAACDEFAAELNTGRDEKIAVGIAADLNNRASVDALVAAASQGWGRLDVLVCNAAVQGYIGDSRDTPPELFDQLLISNVHHNYRLCQAARGVMAPQGGGTIVLIGSVSGHTAQSSVLAYGVSKAAVSHMARMLANEMAPEHIRVNCVAPGLIRSFASEKVWRETDRLKVAVETIPLGRIGEPEDIAGAVIFLASAAGSYVTGTTVHVDGGRAMLPLRGATTHLSGMTGRAVS